MNLKARKSMNLEVLRFGSSLRIFVLETQGCQTRTEITQTNSEQSTSQVSSFYFTSEHRVSKLLLFTAIVFASSQVTNIISASSSNVLFQHRLGLPLLCHPYGFRPKDSSGDRIPVRARYSTTVRTGPEAHPASYTTGTGSFPGVNRPKCGIDHPSHLASRLKKEYSYTSSPPLVFRGLFQGELYLYLYLLPKYSIAMTEESFLSMSDPVNLPSTVVTKRISLSKSV